MARKGSQSKNGLSRNISNHKDTLSDSVEKEKSAMHNKKVVDGELSNGDHQCRSNSPIKEGIGSAKGSGKRSRQRSGNVPCREKSDDKSPNSSESVDVASRTTDPSRSGFLSNDSEPRGDGGTFFGSNCSQNGTMSYMSDGVPAENVIVNNRSLNAVSSMNIRTLALYVLKVAVGWVERQKPWFGTFTAVLCKGHSYVRGKLVHACPIIWTWTLYFGKLMFLLSMIWLDCSIRGLDSLRRLGTTSFFTVLWCSILSLCAMIGFTKMFVVMVIAALAAVFIGLGLAILIFATFALAILWLYGSFWTTGLVIFLGGITFALSHERVALLVTTVYSIHCAVSYVGWMGLLYGLNLSFISSDVLIHFLKNSVNEQKSHDSQDETRQNHGKAGYFYGEAFHASPADDTFQSPSERSSDRSPDVPSTSGADAELTSEDEVARLLNCTDHYSALGLARYENIDISILKREYRKKAMLVHPDKNMGNEKAAEAFKNLQNAYEVLLDSIKRKTYDDELRREELLNYLRKFQNASQKKGRHGIFRRGSNHSGMEDEGLHGESRRIACKKCSDFHVWIFTGRPKSQARWCQECKDFHQAKDGDGWVEQSFQPLLFGLLQKMDPPCAYVCSESRIYDATEWFVCQGMRCPANTHRPSFHVNTNLTSKQSPSKGTGSAYRDPGGMPSANMDETMTEEEFFEWLQNAMQSGMFESSGVSNECPSARNGSSSKSGVKKKRKGKRQW